MRRDHAIFARLDRISRKRALTDAESVMLENALSSIAAEDAVGVGRNGWTLDQEGRFFDLIADGWGIAAAARAVGKTRSAGAGKFHRFQCSLGVQAR